MTLTTSNTTHEVQLFTRILIFSRHLYFWLWAEEFIRQNGTRLFRIVAGIKKSPKTDIFFRREAERDDQGLVAIPEVKKGGKAAL